jgi:hypothetical protein
MRRTLIIVATIVVTASAVRAEDASSSERGPNYPTTEHGPAYPANPSNQEPNPSFGTTAPAPEQRGTSQQELPERPNYYPYERETPAQPER